MNKNKIIIASFVLIIIGLLTYQFYFKKNNIPPVASPEVSLISPIVYKNTDYGFNFSLPANWQGYSIIKNTWEGNALTESPAPSGPKLLIRNPKWTEALPYEDLPILIFTTQQWNEYLAENFSVGAAPIKASELSRNNKYVFAIPARWDFDYSLDFKEAQSIIAGNPLQAFNLEVTSAPQAKLNTDIICENAISYMKFIDKKSADKFVADCKEGKHPEVIEKYKSDMNLGDGAKI